MPFLAPTLDIADPPMQLDNFFGFDGKLQEQNTTLLIFKVY